MCCIFYHNKKKSSHFLRHVDMFVVCSFLCASSFHVTFHILVVQTQHREEKGLLPNHWLKLFLPERRTLDNGHRVFGVCPSFKMRDGQLCRRKWRMVFEKFILSGCIKLNENSVVQFYNFVWILRNKLWRQLIVIKNVKPRISQVLKIMQVDLLSSMMLFLKCIIAISFI